MNLWNQSDKTSIMVDSRISTFRSKNQLFHSYFQTFPRKALTFPQREPHFSAECTISCGKDAVFPQSLRKRAKKVDGLHRNPSTIFSSKRKNPPLYAPFIICFSRFSNEARSASSDICISSRSLRTLQMVLQLNGFNWPL